MDTPAGNQAKASTSYLGRADIPRQESLRQPGPRPRKSLGQHFLVDKTVLRSILSAADLRPHDTVVEVGPGRGVLTKALAKRVARLIAVELDPALAHMLTGQLLHCPNVTVLCGNILDLPPEEMLAPKLPDQAAAVDYKVVANLPYYITSPVLRHFLEAATKPSSMVVMVQREVGDAIVAAPGRMSLLSVRTQFYSSPQIILRVSSESFYPPPRVESVVLRLDVHARPALDPHDIPSFFDVVTMGFCAPRKQLRNALSLATAAPAGTIELLLQQAGIDPTRRAETLSLHEWMDVWRSFTPLLESR